MGVKEREGGFLSKKNEEYSRSKKRKSEGGRLRGLRLLINIYVYMILTTHILVMGV